MSAHPSDSLAQRGAESLMIAAVAASLGVELHPTVISDRDAKVQIDGATSDLTVLVEAYAHIGPLRGAQPKKLATDAFKLSWIGPRVGATTLVLAVLDDAAANYLRRPKAWLTSAIEDAGITVVLVDVDRDVRAGIQDAQVAQFR